MSNVSSGVHRQMREILNNFDFDRVQGVMGFMGWKYSFGAGHDRIPTIKDLRRHAAVMLMYVSRGATNHLSSGGFSVEKHHTSAGDKLSLEFMIESFESKPL